MKRITATELNKHPGQILQMAIQKPVIIEKTGMPTAVVLSYDYFIELEDNFFGYEAAKREENAKWASVEESEKFLKE